MRKIVSILLLAVIIPLFVTTSCRKYEDANEYAILAEYMKANSLDLANITTSWVKPATSTLATPTAGIVQVSDFSVPGYYVMDFRSATDYNNGHIKGAINVVLANAISSAPADKTTKILCVCYTGQTAARACGFLRMAGYTNAVSLKWGMACWNTAFRSKWDSNAAQLGNANWVNTGAPATVGEFDMPVLSTGFETGAEILSARLSTAITNTAWSVSKTDVLANPSNYFINNKWSQAHFDGYGHITGAYRLEEDLKIDNLKYLNPEASTIVTYCYTGQTSSITTAWLNVLGFDNAKSLSFGANGIIWESLKGDVTFTPNAKGSAWKGTGSSSEFQYGYWQTVGTTTDGLYVAP